MLVLVPLWLALLVRLVVRCGRVPRTGQWRELFLQHARSGLGDEGGR